MRSSSFCRVLSIAAVLVVIALLAGPANAGRVGGGGGFDPCYAMNCGAPSYGQCYYGVACLNGRCNPPRPYGYACTSNGQPSVCNGYGSCIPVASDGCENSCGGENLSEGCHCDELCHQNGDCCENVCDVCSMPPVSDTQSGNVVRYQEQHYGPFIVAPGTSLSAELLLDITSWSNGVWLYTRFGAPPTTSNWDCEKWAGMWSPNISCNHTVPNGVTEVYVMVQGWGAVAGGNNYSTTVTWETCP